MEADIPCPKCDCRVSNPDDPDPIDLAMIYHSGCPECRKILPKDYEAPIQKPVKRGDNTEEE